jgi:hypothetical protein
LPGRPARHPRHFRPKARVTKIGPITSLAGHTFTLLFAYSHTIMRGAFVVQLEPETKPAEGRFEGWVEEVDSCTKVRFRSAEELLKFLGQRFDRAKTSGDKTRAGNKCEQVSPKKKACRKERGSP